MSYGELAGGFYGGLVFSLVFALSLWLCDTRGNWTARWRAKILDWLIGTYLISLSAGFIIIVISGILLGLHGVGLLQISERAIPALPMALSVTIGYVLAGGSFLLVMLGLDQ